MEPQLHEQPVPDVADAASLRLTGRVTFDEAPAVRRALLERLRRTGATRLVLELGTVDEMDTSGAAVLAEVLKVGEQRGLRVLFCSPSESVQRIFRLAGFEEVLGQCCPNPAETLRRLVE